VLAELSLHCFSLPNTARVICLVLHTDAWYLWALMQGAPWGGILSDVVYKGSHMYFGGVLLTPSCVVPTQHSSIPGVRLYCGREIDPGTYNLE